MFADIAKGGHSLKKAAPIVKKGRPEDEPARTRLRKWGWGGGAEARGGWGGGCRGRDGKNLVTYQELAAQTGKTRTGFMSWIVKEIIFYVMSMPTPSLSK